MFNEANLSNLLETLLFHSDAVESLGEASIDLVDYCVRQIGDIVSTDNDEQDEDEEMGCQVDEEPEEELSRHARTTQFQVGLKPREL